MLEAKLWRIKCLNNNMAEEFTMRNDDVGEKEFVAFKIFMSCVIGALMFLTET